MHYLKQLVVHVLGAPIPRARHLPVQLVVSLEVAEPRIRLALEAEALLEELAHTAHIAVEVTVIN